MSGRRARFGRRLVWGAALVACSGCQLLFGVDLPGESETTTGSGGSGPGAGAAGSAGRAASSGAGGGGTAGGGGQAGSTPQQGAGGGGGAGGMGAGAAGSGGSPPCEGGVKLVINEVQTEGPGGTNDEFIELFNAGPCDASLDGHALSYMTASASVGVVLWLPQTPGRTLASGTFFVVMGNGYTGPAGDETIGSGQGMSKNGGGLALFKDTTVIDSVAWGTAVATHPYLEGPTPVDAPSTGESLSRAVDGFDSDNNPIDFTLKTPTPGTSNEL